MEWALIITAIIDAIAKCLENRRREDIEERLLMGGGFLERRALTKILRAQDYHGRLLREEVNEGMAMLREMDAEDISCLLDDAEELRKGASE